MRGIHVRFVPGFGWQVRHRGKVYSRLAFGVMPEFAWRAWMRFSSRIGDRRRSPVKWTRPCHLGGKVDKKSLRDALLRCSDVEPVAVEWRGAAAHKPSIGPYTQDNPRTCLNCGLVDFVQGSCPGPA